MEFCTILPSKSYATLFSKSFMNTVIVTLLGMQDLALLFSTEELNNNFNMGNIFLPLALLRLIRLPSALGITVEFTYIDHNSRKNYRRVN